MRDRWHCDKRDLKQCIRNMLDHCQDTQFCLSHNVQRLLVFFLSAAAVAQRTRLLVRGSGTRIVTLLWCGYDVSALKQHELQGSACRLLQESWLHANHRKPLSLKSVRLAVFGMITFAKKMMYDVNVCLFLPSDEWHERSQNLVQRSLRRQENVSGVQINSHIDWHRGEAQAHDVQRISSV